MILSVKNVIIALTDAIRGTSTRKLCQKVFLGSLRFRKLLRKP